MKDQEQDTDNLDHDLEQTIRNLQVELAPVVDQRILADATAELPKPQPAERPVPEVSYGSAERAQQGALQDPSRRRTWRFVMRRMIIPSKMAAAVLVVAVVLLSAITMAATQAGRDFVRWVFTSVTPQYGFTHEATVKTPGSTSTWGGSRTDRPWTAQEIADLKVEHAEMDQIQQAGGGRWVGLIEGPDCTTFLIEYSLSDGSTQTAAHGVLSPKQKANMRAEEILALRDAGAGEIISEWPGSLGLGNYKIRFTLSDGKTVDLKTYYPPGPRLDRETIFAETRELKKQLRFAVERPRGSESSGGVWGILHYALADGRTVGITERVPKEALTPDGKHVAVPESEATKDGWRRLSPEQAEAESIGEAGGGQLISIHEIPNPFDGSSSQWTYFTVEYTLAGGKTFRLFGDLRAKQKAAMRWDEISALRDSGGGELLSHEPSHNGLDRYRIRFTLSDGQTIDLTTNYPPGTRQEREKIFAETRELKKQLRFTVEDSHESSGGIWGLLRYTLADGRTVGISEQVPKEALTPDGKHVASSVRGAP